MELASMLLRLFWRLWNLGRKFQLVRIGRSSDGGAFRRRGS